MDHSAINSESRLSTLRVADRLAQSFHQMGIRWAFGMPGGEIVTFIDALERVGIHFVLARNETAAAMMASANAQLTGVPGLVVTTLGPGLANAVNGLADAMQERAPLIIVSGVVEAAIRAVYTHQIVDHAAMLRPLVKASFEIMPQNAAAVAMRAMNLALSAPFGPVHLDLAPNVAASPDVSALAAPLPVNRIRIDHDAADAAYGAIRAMVLTAERPLILAGLDAVKAGLSDGLAELIEAQHIPLVTTYKAKGLLDERHEYSLGAAGLSPKADKILLPLIQKADLVLLVGYDPIEMRPGWLNPFANGQNVVELGAQLSDHAMHMANWRLEGDLKSLFHGLFKHIRLQPRWVGGDVAQGRAALRAAFRRTGIWGPHAVFETLAAHFPADGLVAVDSGAHRILLSQMWQARRPLEMLQSTGWCTMGSALPLAIGAKLTDPTRKVVAVLGDGGLEMTLGELGTARDQGLDLVVLVLQDESLGLIELKQAQAGLTRAGVRMGATRYDLIAQAFGGTGVNVESREALDAALTDAFSGKGLQLIATRIDAAAYVEAF